MPPLGSFCQKYMYGHFSENIFSWGGNYYLYKTFMEKELKSKCSKLFTEPKTLKGGYIKGAKED